MLAEERGPRKRGEAERDLWKGCSSVVPERRAGLDPALRSPGNCGDLLPGIQKEICRGRRTVSLWQLCGPLVTVLHATHLGFQDSIPFLFSHHIPILYLPSLTTWIPVSLSGHCDCLSPRVWTRVEEEFHTEIPIYACRPEAEQQRKGVKCRSSAKSRVEETQKSSCKVTM